MAGEPSSTPIAKLRDVATHIGPRFDLRLVVLFGSSTRPDAVRPGDMDLAVLGHGAMDAVEITNAFIQALAVQEIDVTDPSRADPLLLALVARDGVPLYEHVPTAFAEFYSLAMRRYWDTAKFREAERDVLRAFGGPGKGA